MWNTTSETFKLKVCFQERQKKKKKKKKKDVISQQNGSRKKIQPKVERNKRQVRVQLGLASERVQSEPPHVELVTVFTVDPDVGV